MKTANSKYYNLVSLNSFEQAPFQFNPWKHHIQFIINNINYLTAAKQLHELNKTILCIGKSLTDLYTGRLTIDEILTELKSKLVAHNTFTEQRYSEWINTAPKTYRKIVLRDNSFWILKRSNERTNYIHLHPGKYSPYTIRVRSLTLKSAILTVSYMRIQNKPVFDIDTINLVRTIYLGEPPVKSISRSRGLVRIIKLLLNQQ